MRRALAAGLVALALLAGCGGDGDDGGRPETADELARVLRDSRGLTDEQAECLADQVFARLSAEEIDRVQDLLAGDEELPADLERKLRQAIVPCA